ncbi:unnamed protein product [Brassica oleracea var. botrytis]
MRGQRVHHRNKMGLAPKSWMFKFKGHLEKKRRLDVQYAYHDVKEIVLTRTEINMLVPSFACVDDRHVFHVVDTNINGSKRVHGEECGSQCNTLVQEKKAAAGLSWFVHPATRLSLLFVLVLDLESQIQYAYWMVVQDSVIPRTLQKSRTKEDGAVIPHVFLRLLRYFNLEPRRGKMNFKT